MGFETQERPVYALDSEVIKKGFSNDPPNTRCAYVDGSGNITYSSTVTSTEVASLDGVSGNIQTQINNLNSKNSRLLSCGAYHAQKPSSTTVIDVAEWTLRSGSTTSGTVKIKHESSGLKVAISAFGGPGDQVFRCSLGKAEDSGWARNSWVEEFGTNTTTGLGVTAGDYEWGDLLISSLGAPRIVFRLSYHMHVNDSDEHAVSWQAWGTSDVTVDG